MSGYAGGAAILADYVVALCSQLTAELADADYGGKPIRVTLGLPDPDAGLTRVWFGNEGTPIEPPAEEYTSLGGGPLSIPREITWAEHGMIAATRGPHQDAKDATHALADAAKVLAIIDRHITAKQSLGLHSTVRSRISDWRYRVAPLPDGNWECSIEFTITVQCRLGRSAAS